MLRDHLDYRPASAVAAPKAGRSGHTVRYARDVRIVVLVAAIFILAIFDLLLTLVAHPTGLLDELNPVGRAALGRGVATLITFKICLTLMGCALLLLARASASGKVAAIAIFMTYAGLAVWWSECVSEFDHAVSGRSTCLVMDSDCHRDDYAGNPKGQDVSRAGP
ncbi:MAG: hypothetical protein JSU86_02780 [Phycisphaerales bacterium]|nr:MAG: hypothetical protein JSU86_02780 [Phycisphaerales bacterium]